MFRRASTYYLAGLITGLLFAFGGSTQADSLYQQVDAYLRPDLPIVVDGQSLALSNAPLMYNDRTYLPLRETATTLGKQVNWNEATQTVELTTPVSPSPTIKPSPTPSLTPPPIQEKNPVKRTDRTRDAGVAYPISNNDRGTFEVADVTRTPEKDGVTTSVTLRLTLKEFSKINIPNIQVEYMFSSDTTSFNRTIKKGYWHIKDATNNATFEKTVSIWAPNDVTIDRIYVEFVSVVGHGSTVYIIP